MNPRTAAILASLAASIAAVVALAYTVWPTPWRLERRVAAIWVKDHYQWVCETPQQRASMLMQNVPDCDPVEHPTGEPISITVRIHRISGDEQFHIWMPFATNRDIGPWIKPDTFLSGSEAVYITSKTLDSIKRDLNDFRVPLMLGKVAGVPLRFDYPSARNTSEQSRKFEADVREARLEPAKSANVTGYKIKISAIVTNKASSGTSLSGRLMLICDDALFLGYLYYGSEMNSALASVFGGLPSPIFAPGTPVSLSLQSEFLPQVVAEKCNTFYALEQQTGFRILLSGLQRNQ